MSDTSVTGRGSMRDRLILCKALAYAILTIERRPFEWREESDKEDMKVMLEHLASGFLGVEYFMDGAKSHMDGERRNVVSMMQHLQDEASKQEE